MKQDLAAACANMDASRLADMLCWGGRSCFRARRQFLPALLGTADPHTLVVRAVTDFLARTEHKMDRFWENCVALLDCVPNLTASHQWTRWSRPIGWRSHGGLEADDREA